MKIMILGCGYVGKSLARALQGHALTLTTQNPGNLPALSAYSENCFAVCGTDAEALSCLLSDQDVLIVCLAAKGKADYETTYLETAKTLKTILTKKPLRQIIYTSSTGVYEEKEGGVVTEESKTSGILDLTEKEFLSLHNTTIFRLGEIYGEERQIKDKLSRAICSDSPTNMIHLHDITGAILFAIQKPLFGVYNLVDDIHETRAELYGRLAQKYGLPLPPFQHPPLRGNKIVSNQKIKDAGYHFIQGSNRPL